MKRILIIDGTTEDRDRLTKIVRGMGNVTVSAFPTGREGQEHFRDFGADCVLLDHRLEGEDGLAVLASLRYQSLFLPILLMCGPGDLELRGKVQESGASGYLLKSRLTAEKVHSAITDAIQDSEQDRRNAGLVGNIKRVMLVEDNVDDRHHIAEMISAAIEGCEVEAMATGTEALAVFAAKDLDCIILDYRLETEDGLTILREIKKSDPFCPVIMLTGQGNEAVAAQSIRVGAADYLVKQRLTETYLKTAIDNAISRAALEAKLADQETQRRQFLKILVHDLRAPLRQVTSLGEMATEEADAGDLVEMKDLLSSQASVAKHANDLISALETYALLDGEVQFEMVSLNSISKRAKDHLTAALVERQAEVVIGELPSVIGHESQLVQLLQNLIQNGLKYNESERPKIVIESESESEGDVIIVISDNGIGMETKYLKTIFSPFKRLWGNSKYQGTGLGLAICQKIVKRHGGTIWCSSTKGEGSQFHIRLPRSGP